MFVWFLRPSVVQFSQVHIFQQFQKLNRKNSSESEGIEPKKNPDKTSRFFFVYTVNKLPNKSGREGGTEL